MTGNNRAGEPVVYAQCPVCDLWAQLARRDDWTLYVHHGARVVHMLPTAPAVGSAFYSLCPDCTDGWRGQCTARLVGERVVTVGALRPCWRCKARGCVPGFVMPL